MTFKKFFVKSKIKIKDVLNKIKSNLPNKLLKIIKYMSTRGFVLSELSVIAIMGAAETLHLEIDAWEATHYMHLIEHVIEAMHIIESVEPEIY